MKHKSTPLFLFPPPLAGLAGGGGLWLVFPIYAIIKLKPTEIDWHRRVFVIIIAIFP